MSQYQHSFDSHLRDRVQAQPVTQASDTRAYIAMEEPADLDHLLRWLGQATGAGAQQYIEMRRKLVALFEFRGCSAAEDLADETLDRTAKAIVKPGFLFEGAPIAYLRGVAHNVYLESLRKAKPISQETLPELVDTVAQRKSESRIIETRHACLDRCLARLSPEKRSLLLRYYQGERSEKIGGRAGLAQQEGLNLNTLRLQIFRLKKIVGRCVETCIKTNEIELSF